MAKKRVLITVLLIALLAIISESVLSIGLRTGELPDYIVAKPNDEHSFTFVADGFGRDVKPYIIADPDMEGYISISDPKAVGKSLKEFTVTIRFPETIDAEPGMREFIVGAEEIVPDNGGVVPKTKVQYRIRVFVLYPGKYIEARFRTQNINVNETADFSVTVNNFGVPDIKVLMATIRIYNGTMVVKSIDSGMSSLKSGESASIPVKVDMAGMLAGEYNATATVYYDHDEIELKDSFRIGQMKVRVTNYTAQIFSGKINRFDIDAENEWNGQIAEVHADVTIDALQSKLVAKTATENIGPMSGTRLTGFIDAHDVLPGEYPVTIELFYEKDKSVERGTVAVVKPSIIEAAGSIGLAVGGGAVAIILALTVLNVMLLLKRKK